MKKYGKIMFSIPGDGYFSEIFFEQPFVTFKFSINYCCFIKNKCGSYPLFIKLQQFFVAFNSKVSFWFDIMEKDPTDGLHPISITSFSLVLFNL